MYSTSLLMFLTFSLVPLCGSSYLARQEAIVVIVPVTDCLGTAAQDSDPTLSEDPHKLLEAYRHIAFSPEAGAGSCPRTHQCLYNEAGRVLEEKGDELHIEWPHFMFQGATELQSNLWVHKSTVRYVTAIHESLRACIPEPLSQTAVPSSKEILTLIVPWKDEEAKTWYSAGTRFVRSCNEDQIAHYAIRSINYQDSSIHTGYVPHTDALVSSSRTLEASKRLFVEILRRWITHQDNTIPYVWGGCSYITRIVADEYFLWEGPSISNWKRPCLPGVQCGFDCSGIILRAAQLAGIRYFCKNTTAIAKMLPDVPSDEPLEVGDLILIKGHVMVISDLEYNLLIDAIGYGSGYGCVREVPLSQAFVGISDYQSLREVVATKQPLSRKNKKGEFVGSSPNARLVRLVNMSHL